MCFYTRNSVINRRPLQHLKHSNHFSASINQYGPSGIDRGMTIYIMR